MSQYPISPPPTQKPNLNADRDAFGRSGSSDCLSVAQMILEDDRNPLVMIEARSGALDRSRVVYANDRYLYLVGHCRDRVIGDRPSFWKQITARTKEWRAAKEAFVNGLSVTCSHVAIEEAWPDVFLDVTVIPLSRPGSGATQRFIAVLRNSSETRRLEDDLRGVMAGARCLLWHSHVERVNGEYSWEMKLENEEAAQKLWPIDRPPGITYSGAWYLARPESDRNRANATGESALERGLNGYSQEFKIKLADGEIRTVTEDVRIEKIGPDRWHLIGVSLDITDRKEAQNQLRDLILRARCMIWQAIAEENLGPSGPLSWHYTVSNLQAALEWLQIECLPDQSFEEAWHMAKVTDDLLPCRIRCRKALQEGRSGYTQEFRMRRRDGEIRWISEDVQIEPITPGRWHLVGVCTDISDRKALEDDRERMLKEALHRADIDGLTGLCNHRVFYERLNAEADRALRQGTRLGVVVADLDNFKFFNDAYGHMAGDEVLRLVADTLRNCCRSFDTVARFGGDEFAVLMPNADISESERLAKRLAETLDHINYQPPGAESPIPLTMSLGAAVFPDDAGSRLDVVEIADARLFLSKTGQDSDGERIDLLKTELLKSREGFAMLNSLIAAVDNKDRYTRRHSEDVAGICLQIAQELGLTAEEQFEIQVAALLHDIGKIGVADAILRKPGALSEDEYEAIKQHPMMGAVIVGAVTGFEFTLDAVRHHHERWDGHGYPAGLRADATPLQARIMAVADAYCAMTTDRTYRKGLAPAAALEVLTTGLGTQWDPDCVHAFLRARGSGRRRGAC